MTTEQMKDCPLRAALETIQQGATYARLSFEARMRGKKSLTWHAVNELQDHIAATEGTIAAALTTPTAPANAGEVPLGADGLTDQQRECGASWKRGYSDGLSAGRRDHATPSPAYTQGTTDAELLAAAETKLRNVISHATGGSTGDTALSLNEICVRITQHVNRAFEGGRAKGRQEGIEAAAKVAANTKLPEGYIWSRANHDKFEFGAQEAAKAIRALIQTEGGQEHG